VRNRKHDDGNLRRAAVVTENSVRSEKTGVPIIREIMVATRMSSLFVAVFALVASSFRIRAALQAESLALRHQLAVFQKNAPRRLRLHQSDRLLWVVLYRGWSGWRRCLEIVQPDTVLRWHRPELSAGIGPGNPAAFPEGLKLRQSFVVRLAHAPNWRNSSWPPCRRRPVGSYSSSSCYRRSDAGWCTSG
jgi:hypothetical protein